MGGNTVRPGVKFGGRGMSMTMGKFVGWYSWVQVAALMYVVWPSVETP